VCAPSVLALDAYGMREGLTGRSATTDSSFPG